MSDSQILMLHLVGVAVLGFMTLRLLMVLLRTARQYFPQAATFGRSNPLLAASLVVLLALPLGILLAAALGASK